MSTPSDLDQWFPETPTFRLSSRPGKEFHLRPINLEDSAWLERSFTSKMTLIHALEKFDWDVICRVVYRLLVEKEEFPFAIQKGLDDEGKPQEISLTGPQMLKRAIRNKEEGVSIMAALTRSLMDSSPIVEEIVKEGVKKNPRMTLDGGYFSTSSPVSTDGPLSKSESSPSERSA